MQQVLKSKWVCSWKCSVIFIKQNERESEKNCHTGIRKEVRVSHKEDVPKNIDDIISGQVLKGDRGLSIWRKLEEKERNISWRAGVVYKVLGRAFWLSDYIIMWPLKIWTGVLRSTCNWVGATFPVASRGTSQHGPEVCWDVKEDGIWKK